MKKALRTKSGVVVTAIVATTATLAAKPASALALLSAAGTALPSIPGMEVLALGLVGVSCLGLARQRANI